MFEIGDKVVYPMYGAGIIKDIEEKEILGEKQQYYIFNMTHSNMEVSIPMGNSSNLGIREVVDDETIENVLSVFTDGEPDMTVNRHQRYHSNMKRMKSGDIQEVAHVIRDLMMLSKDKKIGTEDKNMLDNALQILTSELILVKEITQEEATELINEVMNKVEE
ncbi:CarD family transcriptional regulator [Bacillus sp. FJAT-45350]|uniref:CarD family transcriptional regulator n=1 Tax=Bacillus sp. FJAT-45350 TaxID=2011014 RepID=UPI000BB994D3|nr:CarD family transcriptional regulator [Bacillus sp. FJAT-45350]